MLLVFQYALASRDYFGMLLLLSNLLDRFITNVATVVVRRKNECRRHRAVGGHVLTNEVTNRTDKYMFMVK